jgi:hypothetical protein
MNYIDKIPWGLVIVGCLTLGLAPFFPPHIWEKLVMLSRGELVRHIDWFDLFYHGIPWLLLVAKGAAAVMQRS